MSKSDQLHSQNGAPDHWAPWDAQPKVGGAWKEYRTLFYAALSMLMVLSAGFGASFMNNNSQYSVFTTESWLELGSGLGITSDATDKAVVGRGRAGVLADSLFVSDTLDTYVRQALSTEAAVPEPLPESEDGDDVLRNLGSGMASYYGYSLAGRPTASGEPFDPSLMTAAHPSLPMGALVRVTNLYNEASVIVRINDRGPFVKRRVIDVSRRAARKLGMLRAGHAKVRVELLKEE